MTSDEVADRGLPIIACRANVAAKLGRDWPSLADCQDRGVDAQVAELTERLGCNRQRDRRHPVRLRLP